MKVDDSPGDGVVYDLQQRVLSNRGNQRQRVCDKSAVTSLHSSTRMKKRSNLDMMGAVMAMFCRSALLRSYRPLIGLAAARIEARAFSVAYIGKRGQLKQALAIA